MFAKVAELRSFAAAAAELQLSKATVSKLVSRLEARLGTRLFNRTSRRLALTEAGQKLVERATRLLADAEAAENDVLAHSATPRGTVRLAAPMSFGLQRVAPLLPEFLKTYPDVSVDLHLSDDKVDLIGAGFDAALRIASLPDSSLLAQKICGVSALLVAAPLYFETHSMPGHPDELTGHACFGYAYQATDAWRFTNAAGESATVRPKGPLRANNGDAFLPALLAGLGIALLPDFIVADALARGALRIVMPGWTSPSSALHWVTPPGGPKPARAQVLARFLADRLSRPPTPAPHP